MHSVIIIFLIKASVLSNVIYSPGHSQAAFPTINIRSTLHTAPDLCKTASLAALIGSYGSKYTVSIQSHTYIEKSVPLQARGAQRVPGS